MKKLINKNDKGITLIALVITIIVLLLLAGIAISMLGGENGILNQATNSKIQSESAAEEEAVKLAVLASLTSGNGIIDIDALNEQLKNAGYTGENIESLPTSINMEHNSYDIAISGKVTKVAIGGDNENELNFEVQLLDKLTSVSLSIIPDLDYSDISEEEAVKLIAIEFLRDDKISTLSQLNVAIYNLMNGKNYSYDTDLTSMITIEGISNPTHRDIFAYLMGGEFESVEEWANSEIEYTPKEKALKIGDKDVTEEADWDGKDLTYTIDENGTYAIQLEIDGKVGIKEITISSIHKNLGKKIILNGNEYVVLYDEGELGEGLGAQLISANVMPTKEGEYIYIGRPDLDVPEDIIKFSDTDNEETLNVAKEIYIYNNIVEILNNLCYEAVIDDSIKDYILDIRSVGSNPINKNLDLREAGASEYYASDKLASWPENHEYYEKGIFNGKLKNSDKNFESDLNRMRALNIIIGSNGVNAGYGFASRELFYDELNECIDYGYRSNSAGEFYCSRNGGGNINPEGANVAIFDDSTTKSGVLPVICLKPGVLERLLEN